MGFQKSSILAILLAPFVLTACTETKLIVHTAKQLSQGEQGYYKVGNPYQIGGTWYYPAVDYSYRETGIASWYGPNFHGKPTANGETYDMNAVSAAHRTLPIPSMVQVTNLENGRSLRVRINDRGPFARGRIIDLSRRGAQLLGFEQQGTARVRVEILADESRQIAALYGAGKSDLQVARANAPDRTGSGDSRIMPKPAEQAQPDVKAAPTISVTKASLPVEEGAGGEEIASGNLDSVSSAGPRMQTAKENRSDRPLAEPVADPAPELSQVPVSATNMYIQAGAFAQYHNANRLKARLSTLGHTRVTSVQIGEQQLFRVRLGPIQTLEEADSLLASVVNTGIENARLIVDEE